MLVCHCEAVSDRVIRVAVRGGARDVAAVGRACGAGTSCGGCRPAIQELIVEVTARERCVGAGSVVWLRVPTQSTPT